MYFGSLTNFAENLQLYRKKSHVSVPEKYNFRTVLHIQNAIDYIFLHKFRHRY